MRKTMLVLLAMVILALGSIVQAETVSWINPTAYNDGTTIAPADQVKIVTHLFSSVTQSTPWPWPEFAKTAPGATQWVGTLPIARGLLGYYTITSELNSLQSAQFTPVVGYTSPFIATAPPSTLLIKP
jgi:hypothetical protein